MESYDTKIENNQGTKNVNNIKPMIPSDSSPKKDELAII
jgi:hypothetical protein